MSFKVGDIVNYIGPNHDYLRGLNLAVKSSDDFLTIVMHQNICYGSHTDYFIASQQTSNPVAQRCTICAADYGTQAEANYCKELCEALSIPTGVNSLIVSGGVRQDASHVVQMKCECGSEACGSPLHSEYCPKFQRND